MYCSVISCCTHVTGRLRVNMGNIYFEQKKYPQAVKMYRMALDQIQNVHKDVRYVLLTMYYLNYDK